MITSTNIVKTYGKKQIETQQPGNISSDDLSSSKTCKVETKSGTKHKSAVSNLRQWEASSFRACGMRSAAVTTVRKETVDAREDLFAGSNAFSLSMFVH